MIAEQSLGAMGDAELKKDQEESQKAKESNKNKKKNKKKNKNKNKKEENKKEEVDIDEVLADENKVREAQKLVTQDQIKEKVNEMTEAVTSGTTTALDELD